VVGIDLRATRDWAFRDQRLVHHSTVAFWLAMTRRSLLGRAVK
jgi:hypothetical protein